MTLNQGHGCGIDKQKFACLQDKVTTAQPIITKLGSYITLVMLITWFDFGGMLEETLILANFIWKFRMCVFKVKHSFGHIRGMVGPIDMIRKGDASIGYWVNKMTLTFDLNHDLDFDFSGSNFKIAVSQQLLSDWCETKRKLINEIMGWLFGIALGPHPWPWTCSFKVKVWNSLIWGLGGLTDMERKGCESIIHNHDSDLWLTGGWM